MKKKVVNLLFISIIGILLFSCQKENLVSEVDRNQDNANRIEDENEVLVFSTIEEYEEAINELSQLGEDEYSTWEEQRQFISMRNGKTTEELDEIGIYDPLFACLINPYGIVIIENFAYKVDLMEEIIYALPYELYKDENSFLSMEDVQVFSIDDEVLFSEENKSQELKSFCPSQNTTWYSWYCSGGNVKYRNRYFKAGIYFSLVARVEPNGSGVNGLASTNNCSWTYNQGTYTYSGSSSLQQSHHNLRPYNSTRRLSKFYFQANYYFIDYSTNTSYSPSLTISCN